MANNPAAVTITHPDHIGQAIAFLRHLNGWTQRQLADKSGVRQSIISAVEAGRPPRWSTLNRLLTALNVQLTLTHTE